METSLSCGLARLYIGGARHICGNKYRLRAKISYKKSIVLIWFAEHIKSMTGSMLRKFIIL